MAGPSRAYALALTGFFSACAHATGTNPADAHLANATREMGRPAILASGEGEHRLMQGQRSVYILIDSATTGSTTLVAGLTEMLPGDSIPTHKHLGEEEMLFVHRGTVDVTLGEQTRHVGPGGTAFIPRGTWVGARAVGADTATILFVFNAPSYEKCLRAQSSLPGERYAPPSAEVLQQVRRDCHHVRKSG